MNAKLLTAIEQAHSRYQAVFLYEGNFVICLLLDANGNVESFGIAKRNPNCDDYDLVRGSTIAEARAVKKLTENARQIKNPTTDFYSSISPITIRIRP